MSRKKMFNNVNGEKIKRILEEKGMSQADLATAIDRKNYQTLWSEIHYGRMSEETLEKICQVLDVAPEYIRDLTGGLDWLTGEETRLNYAFHLYQGASLYKGTAELLKTVYINPAKLSKRQMDSAMDKFYELACRIRSEIEKDDSKKSSV